jgi:hypothetical protein
MTGFFALLVTVPASNVSAGTAVPQAPAASSAATAAAQASPDLIAALSKEIGGSAEQSAGAAGLLFGLAKSRLKPAEFAEISKAVPGMSALLKLAPSTVGTAGHSPLGQLEAEAGGLAAAASGFSKLGLSPDLVAKAVPVLTSFVTKSGGAKAGNLLAGALK